jgi:hypothetical protein
MVAHVCNSRYDIGISRRIVVPDPREKLKTLYEE